MFFEQPQRIGLKRVSTEPERDRERDEALVTHGSCDALHTDHNSAIFPGQALLSDPHAIIGY